MLRAVAADRRVDDARAGHGNIGVVTIEKILLINAAERQRPRLAAIRRSPNRAEERNIHLILRRVRWD